MDHWKTKWSLYSSYLKNIFYNPSQKFKQDYARKEDYPIFTIPKTVLCLQVNSVSIMFRIIFKIITPFLSFKQKLYSWWNIPSHFYKYEKEICLYFFIF